MNDKIGLFFDIDGTSYIEGDNSLIDYINENREKFILTYVTGRSAENRGGEVLAAMDLVHEGVIPEPDYIIGDVGAEIFDVKAGKYHEGWPLTKDSRWSIDGMGDVINENLVDGFVDGTETAVTKQPAECQGSYKSSYFLKGAEGVNHTSAKDILAKALAEKFDCKVVFSSNRDFDILPANVDKGAAVSFLANDLKIKPENRLVAGDSGNDILLFNASDAGMAIIPGNSSLDLLKNVVPEVASLFGQQNQEIVTKKPKQSVYYNSDLKGPSALVAGIKHLTQQ